MTFPTPVTDFFTARAERAAAERRATRAVLLAAATFAVPAPRPCTCARCMNRADMEVRLTAFFANKRAA